MLQLLIATATVMLTAFYINATLPNEMETQRAVRGDVAALNLLTYRRSVIDFVNANPGASGAIADASLSFPLGFVRGTQWASTIQGGTLFVYSTGTLDPDVVGRVYTGLGKYLLVGTKSAAGTLLSASGTTINQALPATIGTGALVIVGR